MLHLEGTVDDMMNMIHAHPTVWEAHGRWVCVACADCRSTFSFLIRRLVIALTVAHAFKDERTCLIVDLGLIGYAEAWELQKRVVAARKADAIGDVLLLCEHPHVITLGRSGKRENLLASEHVLAQKGVEFHATNRGGDITYHGPGQIGGLSGILNLGGDSARRRVVCAHAGRSDDSRVRRILEIAARARRRQNGRSG